MFFVVENNSWTDTVHHQANDCHAPHPLAHNVMLPGSTPSPLLPAHPSQYTVPPPCRRDVVPSFGLSFVVQPMPALLKHPTPVTHTSPSGNDSAAAAGSPGRRDSMKTGCWLQHCVAALPYTVRAHDVVLAGHDATMSAPAVPARDSATRNGAAATDVPC